MSRILVYLGRLIIITAGYLVASLAASTFLHVVILGPLDFTAEELPWVVTGSAVFSVPFVAVFMAYFAFAPSIPAIFLAEVFGRRDWLFHAIAGGVVAMVVIGFIWRNAAPGHEAVADARFAMTMIGSGLVGGIAYWAVAGRMAGGWRSSTISPAPSKS